MDGTRRIVGAQEFERNCLLCWTQICDKPFPAAIIASGDFETAEFASCKDETKEVGLCSCPGKHFACIDQCGVQSNTHNAFYHRKGGMMTQLNRSWGEMTILFKILTCFFPSTQNLGCTHVRLRIGVSHSERSKPPVKEQLVIESAGRGARDGERRRCTVRQRFNTSATS